MSTLRRIMLGSGEIDLSKIPENRKVYYEAVEKLNARPFPLIANKYDSNTKEGILVSSKDIITLPSGAFNGQTGLKKIILPSSVTTIGSNAFKGCTLDELVLQSPFLETDFVRNVTSWGTVSYNNYWGTGATINKLILKGYPNNEKNSELNIGNYIFADYNIKRVEFDESVKYTLGEGSFDRSKIEEIVLDPKSFDLEIPKMCFNNCYYLKKITLGERVVKLGYRAFFGGDSLETLIIKTNLSNCEFDSEYFSACTKNSDTLSLYLYNNTLSEFVSSNLMSSLASYYETPTYIYINDELLKNVIIPDDVSEIKYSVFKNSIIESVEIPNNVVSIYDGAFKNCSKLNNVKIGTGVSNIGTDVFLGVSGEITIDSNIIGNDFSHDTSVNNSFLKGSNFTTVNIGNNVTKIGKRAFAYLDLENVILGNSLVEIESNAFYGCDKLSNVNISNSVTTIGDMAFHSCESLTSINIPDSVTSIGDYVFKGCSSLPVIDNIRYADTYLIETVDKSLTTCSIKPGTRFIGREAFNNCDSLTSIDIPNSVTYIGPKAFQSCDSLTSVIIPEGVTNINSSAFYSCDNLTSVTIPDSVTEIRYAAFAYCSSLTSITIPDSVTTIGKDAFCNCYSLTSVTIGNSVTTIGEEAFSFCSRLTSITIPDSVTTIGKKAFRECNNLTEFNGKFAEDNGRILVVDGVLIALAKVGITEYTIPNSITTIVFGAFDNNSNLTSITIPDSVTTIGETTFGYCRGLTSVNIPDSVTEIGERAFIECRSLSSVTIPNNVTIIKEDTFRGCSSLANITIGNSVTEIGKQAFSGCTSLTSITIPDSVTTIGVGAFSSCDNLTSVDIPESVTSIGSSAFSSCDSLINVNISDSVTTIGSWAFSSCDSLINVNISDSVTTIGSWAFDGCNSLTSVTIPNSITSIGGYAFRDCTNLTSVYCKATTPPALDSYVFDNNGSGRKIYVPAESVDSYKSAKYWSEYADAIVGYDFENNTVIE